MNQTYPNIQATFVKNMGIEILDTEKFIFEAMHRSIVRKWNGVCISIDHVNNQAQVSHNGVVSDKRDPHTAPNMGGKYGGEMISKPTEFTVLIARYFFDKNILIGDIVGINVWNRTLTNEELASYTNCSAPVKARGTLVNEDTIFEYRFVMCGKYVYYRICSLGLTVTRLTSIMSKPFVF